MALRPYRVRPDRDFPSPFAGCDETGRGCLAGPVVAAAVVMPEGPKLRGLTDSKLIPAEKREALALRIRERALAWGVGMCWPREIDRYNIHQASLLAMARAVSVLRRGFEPVLLVIDGRHSLPLHRDVPQKPVVDGDLLIPNVSAASVLAKTVRDRLMAGLDRKYPGYGLASNKGYGCKAHAEGLRELGPCPLHRRSFKSVKDPGAIWLPGI
jgi:ribonuclease HII